MLSVKLRLIPLRVTDVKLPDSRLLLKSCSGGKFLRVLSGRRMMTGQDDADFVIWCFFFVQLLLLPLKPSLTLQKPFPSMQHHTYRCTPFLMMNVAQGVVYFGMFLSVCVCVYVRALAKHHIHHFLHCTFPGHPSLVMFVVALREIEGGRERKSFGCQS